MLSVLAYAGCLESPVFSLPFPFIPISFTLFVLAVCRKVYLLWRVMKLFDYLGVFSTNHQTHHFILIGFTNLSFTGFASTTHHDHPVCYCKDILHVVTNQDD